MTNFVKLAASAEEIEKLMQAGSVDQARIRFHQLLSEEPPIADVVKILNAYPDLAKSLRGVSFVQTPLSDLEVLAKYAKNGIDQIMVSTYTKVKDMLDRMSSGQITEDPQAVKSLWNIYNVLYNKVSSDEGVRAALGVQNYLKSKYTAEVVQRPELASLQTESTIAVYTQLLKCLREATQELPFDDITTEYVEAIPDTDIKVPKKKDLSDEELSSILKELRAPLRAILMNYLITKTFYSFQQALSGWMQKDVAAKFSSDPEFKNDILNVFKDNEVYADLKNALETLRISNISAVSTRMMPHMTGEVMTREKESKEKRFDKKMKQRLGVIPLSPKTKEMETVTGFDIEVTFGGQTVVITLKKEATCQELVNILDSISSSILKQYLQAKRAYIYGALKAMQDFRHIKPKDIAPDVDMEKPYESLPELLEKLPEQLTTVVKYLGPQEMPKDYDGLREYINKLKYLGTNIMNLSDIQALALTVAMNRAISGFIQDPTKRSPNMLGSENVDNALAWAAQPVFDKRPTDINFAELKKDLEETIQQRIDEAVSKIEEQGGQTEEDTTPTAGDLF